MKRLLLLPLVALVLGACDDSRTATAPAENDLVASMNAAAATYDCEEDQTQILPTECEALVALYNATDGPNWTNEKASPPDEPWLVGSPCDWYGVGCAGGLVWGLGINENNLTGSIPAALGGLSALQDLNLLYNQLSGPIPPELGNLSKLKRLLLAYTQLSGPIPPELGNLSNLEHLGIAANQLTGVIPAELGNLSNLAYLHLYGNQLSGPIPASLGNLTSLVHLQVHDNQLSGPIPASLGNLSLLESLWLAYNHLGGLVPIEVARLGGSWPTSEHCAFVSGFVSGNDGLYMPDTQPYLDADQDNDGHICRLALSSFVPVAIDIKPGSDPNCIKDSSKGRIPVAILSESVIDFNDIDVSTVKIDDDTDPGTAGVPWVRWSLNKDVSGDGVPDLVLHFPTKEMRVAGLLDDWKTLYITGGLFDGTAILGSDVINLAGGDYCFDQEP